MPTKGPCPDCGSSDACVTYEDGHTHCYSCNKHTPNKPSNRKFVDVEYRPLKSRGISLETCTLFKYGVAGNKQIAQFFKDGELVAQKSRDKDKNFLWTGKSTQLFGQHVWSPGGKKLVITEGEIDALSVSQVQGNKWPVVSIPSGCTGGKKAIEANIDFVNSFEEIVLMFDNDEPGIAAAHECAAVLPPGKCKIATLPLKDANDMLVAGRGEEIVKAMWNAKPWRPDGILAMSDCWEKMIDTQTCDSYPYPWGPLDDMLMGMRTSEVVTVVAGTGVGKSEFTRQIAYGLRKATDLKIGYIALEEDIQRTARGFVGLHLGKRLNLHKSITDVEGIRKAFDEISENIFLYDHFGSTEGDNLLSRIRYMVTALGCKVVVLDHISIAVSGLEIDDERKALDVLSTKLKTLCMELKFTLLLVVHTRSSGDGKTHEEGGRVTLQDIRGTRAIGQISNIIIGLERDLQDSNSNTRVRILKNRFSGMCGVACMLAFNRDTGHFELAVGSDAPSDF
jgi:twinkle protein